MDRNPFRYQGSLRHVIANWPTYAVYGGLILLCLLVVVVGTDRSWFAFIPLSLAVLIVLVYFLTASIWESHMLRDRNGLQAHHVLFDMGQIESDDIFAFIDLGLRQEASELSQRLTSGKILVIDVYSPQWTPSSVLARMRARAPVPAHDPRIEWHAADINLLPLPDRAVSAVVLCHLLSHFWQRGDQRVLLREIHRVLASDGRLLIAEQTRSEMNWLLKGPSALRLPSISRVRDLIATSGFQLREERSLQGITHCLRADKRPPDAGRQLELKLNL